MTDPRAVFREQKSKLQQSQEEFAARKAFATAKSRHRQALPVATLGAEFDPETTADIGLRWSLSRGDTLEEKQVRLKERFPEGELQVMEDPGFGTGQGMFREGGAPIMMYRESPQSQWKRVEPEGMAGDVAGDIAEMVGPSAESIAFETVMAIGSGGASVPATVGRQILGAVAGEALEQGVQSITDRQRQSAGEVAGEISFEGLMSGIGGFAASPLVAGRNIATGRGALRVGEEGMERVQAARRLDPELGDSLTPGMVSDNPAIRTTEKQSVALVPGISRRYREIAQRLDRAVTGQIDPQAKAKMVGRVRNSLQGMQDEFLSRLKGRRVKASEGGRALQEGIVEFNQVQKQIVDDAYAAARSIEEPQFNLRPVFDTANDLRAGAKGTLNPQVESVIREIEAIEGPIQKSDGSYVTVTDQLRNARTQLNSLAHVEPGKVANQANGQANDLRKALNEAMRNPENANPAFQQAWKEADAANRAWRETTEKTVIIQAAKSQNPADLVRTYASPGQVDNLLTLRSTVSPEKWENFQGAFYADLISDPSALSRKLYKFDQETLDVLMPRADQEAWRSVAREMDRITALGVDEIAERQVTNKNFINRLIQSGDPRDVLTLIRASNRTNDQAMRASVRSTILEWAWDGVVQPGKDTLEVNRNLLKSRIDQLKKSGMWRILSREEKQIIGDTDVVARGFQDVANAGTQLIGASVVQGMQRLHAASIMTFVRSGLLGQFYTSSLGRRILIGSGLPNSNGRYMRLLSGAMAQILPPEDISRLAENEEQDSQQ